MRSARPLTLEQLLPIGIAPDPGAIPSKEENMATTKGKRGIKKSARLKKGMVLRPVKPLKETVSFTFGTTTVQYTKQAPIGTVEPVVSPSKP